MYMYMDILVLPITSYHGYITYKSMVLPICLYTTTYYVLGHLRSNSINNHNYPLS